MSNIVEGGCDIDFGWIIKPAILISILVVVNIALGTMDKTFITFKESLIIFINLLPTMFLILSIFGLIIIPTIFAINYLSEDNEEKEMK